LLHRSGVFFRERNTQPEALKGILAAVLASAAGYMFVSASQEAQAAELRSAAGASIALGNVSGSARYAVEPDGYRLVATLSSGVVPHLYA
jgi:hypothetical protein